VENTSVTEPAIAPQKNIGLASHLRIQMANLLVAGTMDALELLKQDHQKVKEPVQAGTINRG
jgi:hypothetical protein